MRVAYYAQSAYLEPTLLLAAELASYVELHLLLEVPPMGWQIAAFDTPSAPLPSGLAPIDGLLPGSLPTSVRDRLRGLASFQIVTHTQRRAFHPASWQVSRSVTRFLGDLAPDVVHIDDDSPRLALAANSLPRSPMVLSIHDPLPHTGEFDWRSEAARWLLFRRVDRFVLRSRALMPAFCKRYRVSPHRVRSVPMGVYDLWPNMAQPGATRPGERSERPTILFFGRLSPYKGLDWLYRVAPRVAARVPDLRIVVAGRPVRGYRLPEPPNLGGTATIEVCPRYLSNPEVSRLFGSATVVACPYTDATQSGVVLTAYAFGKPVVATMVGGLPEYVHHGQTGLLVPPADDAALENALVAVLLDGALRARLESGIRESAKHELRWSTIAQPLLAIYRELVATP